VTSDGAAHLPDFAVVGAARAGTTALSDALSAHPQVCMSTTKEPGFFLFEQTATGPRPLIGPDRALLAKSVSSPAAYARLFTRTGPGVVTGDASPLYLYTAGTAALLARDRAGTRVVAVLRDPAERAWSHFLYTWTGAPDDAVAGFRAAVDAEWDAGYTPYTRGSHHLRVGRYAEQLARYFEVFPAEQVLLLDFRQLVAEPERALETVQRFLGVHVHTGLSDRVRRNAAGVPRPGPARVLEQGLRAVQPHLKRALPAALVPPLARLREGQRRRTSVPVPPLPADLRDRLLADYYADDLARLRREWGVELV
jgi:hypothetical protein